MTSNVCNNCGGAYDYRHGRWICPFCGAYKPEGISNEEVTLLYTASQKLRLADFDEAEREFDDIVRKFPQNPNGYWGRLMSKYGIKYEEDFDGQRIPTCYASSIESVIADPDYQHALKYADEETKAYFVKQARYMERVRKEWMEKARKEKPYDIFICYKDSDLTNGIERTTDSLSAQDLYIHLTNKGYRVFFSHESLRDKVGEKYEPYIFSALSTAQVMLVYGSKPEYITSTWLKNEWTRYEKRIKAGEKKANSLLVACEGFSPNALPKSLASRQCFNANDRSFYGDLDAAIDKILKKKKEPAPVKKKSKAPLVVTLLTVALLAIGGLVAWNLLQQDADRGMLTNDRYQATVVAHDKEFPNGTVFSVEEIPSAEQSEALRSVISGLPVTVENYHVYDMNLMNNGRALTVDGNITVTLALPEDVSAERAVVYYLTESSGSPVSSETSNSRITFVTNHFSYYMVAEVSETETETEPHEHVYGEWVITPATCTEEGSRSKYCACGDAVRQVESPATGHTDEGDSIVDVAATIYAEGSGYVICATCLETLRTDVVIPKIISQGLSYEINEDGITCTITGMGTCKDTEIGIPSIIDGYMVTSIGAYAFFEDSYKSIVIPDSVTTIGNGAFAGCSLTSIVIPNSVTIIDESAFFLCNILAVYYAGTLEQWNEITIDSYTADDVAPRYHYSENQPVIRGNYWHYVDGVPTKWDTKW